IALRLQELTTAEEILAIEQEIGQSQFDQQRTSNLVNFLESFVAQVNEQPQKKYPLRRFQPPRHIITFEGKNAYQNDEIIKRVEVVQSLSFYDGKNYSEIRLRKILTVEIPIY
ncbi:MAG: hypothetical protein ACR2MX_01590, partial [Cyclobacteriaceae bacterium]